MRGVVSREPYQEQDLIITARVMRYRRVHRFPGSGSAARRPASQQERQRRRQQGKRLGDDHYRANPFYSAHSRDSKTTIVQHIDFTHRVGVTRHPLT